MNKINKIIGNKLTISDKVISIYEELLIDQNIDDVTDDDIKNIIRLFDDHSLYQGFKKKITTDRLANIICPFILNLLKDKNKKIVVDLLCCSCYSHIFVNFEKYNWMLEYFYEYFSSRGKICKNEIDKLIHVKYNDIIYLLNYMNADKLISTENMIEALTGVYHSNFYFTLIYSIEKQYQIYLYLCKEYKYIIPYHIYNTKKNIFLCYETF